MLEGAELDKQGSECIRYLHYAWYIIRFTVASCWIRALHAPMMSLQASIGLNDGQAVKVRNLIQYGFLNDTGVDPQTTVYFEIKKPPWVRVV